MSVATPQVRVTPTIRTRTSSQGSGGAGLWVTRVILIVICGIVLLPALWVITASLQPGDSAYSSSLIPQSVTMDHYKAVIDAGFFIWVKNSFIVSGCVALVTLTINTLAAYAFSRLRFWGKRYGLMTLFLVQMFPATMSIVAIYTVLINLGLIDSLPGLILVYMGSSAFEIWLLKNYIDSIPRELDDAALIDGATPFQLFYKILLPLIRPMLATVLIWNFSGTYNEFLFSSLLLKNSDNYTVMVGLFNLVTGSYATKWTIFAAGAVMAAVPILVLYLSLQRQLIAGLSAGGVKG